MEITRKNLGQQGLRSVVSGELAASIVSPSSGETLGRHFSLTPRSAVPGESDWVPPDSNASRSLSTYDQTSPLGSTHLKVRLRRRSTQGNVDRPEKWLENRFQFRP